MIAMDVVDTLRHRERLVMQELHADDRRMELIKRLRDMYAAQGIQVSDEVLEEGVDALEDERFNYIPTKPSLQAKLAGLYIKRKRWLKPICAALAVLLIALVAYFVFVAWPKHSQRNQLPDNVESLFVQISALAANDTVTAKAQTVKDSALLAHQQKQYQLSATYLDDLQRMLNVVSYEYQVRIVSRPNARSGVWRLPNVNTTARNYYLIVEAVDNSGRVLSLPIKNEENNLVKEVSVWGLRVDYATFQRFETDKKDDGIIQKNIIGRKPKGYVDPSYYISTSGATITQW